MGYKSPRVDKWRWTLDGKGEFTVKELARLVEEKILHTKCGGHETIWNKLVPKKVNIFVWRAIEGRLPVRVELNKRGIDLDSVLCPCCNNSVETCAHCFVTCDLAMGVWDKVSNWWMVGNVNTFSINELFSFNGGVNVPSHLYRVWRLFGLPVTSFGKKEMPVRISVPTAATVLLVQLVLDILGFMFCCDPTRYQQRLASNSTNGFIPSMPRTARNGEAGTSKMVGCEINKSATVHLEVKVIESESGKEREIYVLSSMYSNKGRHEVWSLDVGAIKQYAYAFLTSVTHDDEAKGMLLRTYEVVFVSVIGNYQSMDMINKTLPGDLKNSTIEL
ncbi:RNA-directed DNA polymerase, eukaryota, reverse transcriptase zinc-binding domain protein [Tanacetum coccineum]